MGSRIDLQALLESFCPNVYFQEPEASGMVYPCIIYHRDDTRTEFANNKPYKHKTRYQVTIIQREPDKSDIHEKVAALPLCSYNRFYTADNLNHDVFNLFF